MEVKYGAPFMNHDWAKWDSTLTEKTHTQFLKILLGVNRSTTNIFTRSEVGRHSLQEKTLTRNINYINCGKQGLLIIGQAGSGR